jgi:cell division protease FtsH
MNEGAISAARKDKAEIGWEEIDSAVDRVMVGLEKRGADVPALRKELVAFHEAGHAIVGAVIPDYDMVQKVTIIPRSNGAGGLTFFAPNEDRCVRCSTRPPSHTHTQHPHSKYASSSLSL